MESICNENAIADSIDSQLNQEKRYTITFDIRKVIEKPNDKYRGTITNHLIHLEDVTIEEFAGLVQPPYSLTWSGNQYNGSRSNKNWISSCAYAVDFDKGTISIEEVIKRIQNLGITPQIHYYTFSDTPELRKFRIVFFLNTPITDRRINKMLIDGLLKLYPEADQTCKDFSRYFFGGKESTVISKKSIPVSKFIDSLSIYIISKDSFKTRKLPLSSEYYTNINSVSKPTFLYKEYRNTGFQTSFEDITPTTSSVQGGIRADFNELRKRIKIFDSFCSGEWLYHDQLYGLATNMIYFEGGAKFMKEIMEKYNKEGLTDYGDEKLALIQYVKATHYPPALVHTFSPHPEDMALHDMISEARDIRGHIEQLEPIKKINLPEAEKLLEQKYNDVLINGKPGKIYLFCLPTAIGKTQSLINTNAVIAAPTNDLKNEIAKRMQIKCTTTPDKVVFDDAKINWKLDYLYSVGLPKKAMKVLNYITLPENSKFYNSSDIALAKRFLQQLNESQASEDAVITTHQRALFTEFNHNTIIFDEDPLNSLIDIKTVKISDVYIASIVTGLKELDELRIILQNAIPGEINETPKIDFDDTKLIENVTRAQLESNLFEFFNSSFFIRVDKDIHYVVKRDLPVDKKIVIMSATIPVYIYQKLFPDRVEVVEIRDVEQQGTITQYTKWSCSRNGLNRYVNVISDMVDFTPVLTFQSFQDKFKNPIKEMYFGNCSGYDSYKGKDIAVVGTPHRNNIQYFLTAKILGVDFQMTDATMSHQKIEYNGFRFKFNCFDNEVLRNIQLSFIESDLIQAVGRARTLRTNAKVDVYSNFPLRIATEFRY